jgi:hypothetical protein
VSNQDASIQSTPFFLWLLVGNILLIFLFPFGTQKKLTNYYIWMKG